MNKNNNIFYEKYLFKVSYFGYKNSGFEKQKDGDGNSIEDHLFNSLKKVNLIEDINDCDYSKCGRTDKGVSAVCNYICLKIKVNKNNINQNYVKRINSKLPKNIRILSQLKVNNEFNCRFDCEYREYRYYFNKLDYNIEKMKLACKNFIGTNDFRNFCKINISQTKNFIREIIKCNIITLNNNYCYLEIRGSAFLWHMVRYIMGILFIIGKENEEPSIIKELFDIKKNPSKPCYDLVSPEPLILYKCKLKKIKDNEETNIEDDFHILKNIESKKEKYNLKIMHFDLIKDNISNKSFTNIDLLLRNNLKNSNNKKKPYKKLLERDKCLNVEELINKKIKKTNKINNN